MEASAGTGKTYTIGSIYLRYFYRLVRIVFLVRWNVEEILVVTFTEMATEDLKRKIQGTFNGGNFGFSEYYEKQDKAIFTGEHQFLAELLPYLENIPTALRRLKAGRTKFRFSLHFIPFTVLSPNADATCFQFRRAFQFKTSQRSV